MEDFGAFDNPILDPDAEDELLIDPLLLSQGQDDSGKAVDSSANASVWQEVLKSAVDDY